VRAIRYLSIDVELARWLLLMIAAICIVLAIASALAAADPMKEPRLLPDMGSLAKPIAPALPRPFFPENPPVRQLPPAEAASRLWTILDNHRALRNSEALAGWEQVWLPAETAHWRNVGLAASCLHLGDLVRASTHLAAAREMAPENAVVAYYMGLLRLEEAAAAGRVPDATKGRSDLLVAYTPAKDRMAYQSLAINELRLAIIGFRTIPLDEPLLEMDAEIDEIVVVPRVNDLLVALGADNLAGKAHHLLFGLHLSRGELTDAEFHLQEAVLTGIAPLYGSRDLGEAYLGGGADADAARLALKDLQTRYPELGRFCERLAEWTTEAARRSWTW
jgi:hypothetical protein